MPSRLVLSDALRTSKMPGSVCFTVLLAVSRMIFQESAEPVMITLRSVYRLFLSTGRRQTRLRADAKTSPNFRRVK